MRYRNWTRREMIRAIGGVAVSAMIPSILRAGEAQTQMRIGILLGTFGGSYEAKLDKAKANGIACVQVSMDCLGLATMPEEIGAEVAGRVKREAEARGIEIAAVDGTFNMCHPDAEQRKAGLRRLHVLAGACGKMGTSRIHICSGTRDRGSMWRRHPENDTAEAWRDMVGCMKEAAGIAKEARVVLAVEPEVNNVVDSAKKARRLMDEVGSEHLKVTIDGANVFHKGELGRMREVLEEAFELIGKDIVLAHAKDLDHDGDAGHLAAGKGKLDYELYMGLLKKVGFRGPVLLHGLGEAQVGGCVGFLREKMGR